MQFRKLTLAELSASLLLALVVSLFVGICSRTAAYGDYELWGYDFLVNHGASQIWPSQIVIVDFDDATFDRIKQYPIPRSTIARIISSVAANSPRVIGLDMFLTEVRSPEDDVAMSTALAGAGTVILASQVGEGGIPALRPLLQFCEPEVPKQVSGYCKEAPRGAVGYAAVNLPVDSDGFVRSFFLFAGEPRNGVSFPVMVAQLATGQPLEPLNDKAVSFLGKRIPTLPDASRRVLIGTWCRHCAKHVSALSLLDRPTEKNKDFEDKIVLVGQSNDAARDLILTPLFRPEPGKDPRTRLSGTEILSAAIETLLSGNAVFVLPSGMLWAVVFCVCALSVWLQMRYQLRVAIAVIVGLILLLCVVAVGLLSWGQIWFQYTTVIFGVALSVPVSVAYRFVQERVLRSAAMREREQIMGLFSRYVSREAAQQIWERRDELVLAGEERTASVLFSDIRSFTALTAGKDSRMVLRWLNEYLSAMDEVIRAHGGFLNKFIGDGLMVLFGVPLSDGLKADACRALRCAEQMLERVEKLNILHQRDPDFPAIKIGIGLHTGKLTCGNIGSENRVEYSVIGETVNLASRLEGLTKDFGTGIVLSADTYMVVRENFPLLRELGDATVRGFEGQIRIYGLSRVCASTEFAKSPSGGVI